MMWILIIVHVIVARVVDKGDCIAIHSSYPANFRLYGKVCKILGSLLRLVNIIFMRIVIMRLRDIL